MKIWGGWWSLAALCVVLLGVHAPAHAGGRNRAIPDLRRDAEAWTQSRSGARRLIQMPLTVHIATADGDPIASQARVARWVRRANEELAPAGIEVRVRSVRHLPEGWDRVTRWLHRRQLAAYAPHDGSIHVFVVEELDTSSRRRFRRRIRGMHWRYHGLNRKLRSREYVVVTREAPNTTFAHELGHLFGLRHSSAENNIMCSCRRGAGVDFTRDQNLSMRSGAYRFVQRHSRGRPRMWADRPRRR